MAGRRRPWIYELSRGHLAALIGLYAVAPMFGGEALFGVILGVDIPLGWLVLLAIVAWNAYWFLLRFAYAATVDGGVLYWKAPLRSGTLVVAQLDRVRPSRVFSNIQVVQTADGRRVMVWAVKGFTRFIGVVASRRPGLPVHLQVQTRLAEHLPVKSTYHAEAGGPPTC